MPETKPKFPLSEKVFAIIALTVGLILVVLNAITILDFFIPILDKPPLCK